MPNGFIRVAPDGTGKAMQTYENTIATVDVHAEAVVLVDENGNPISGLPVSGTVELGATTLAALENITVTVSSEVEIKNDAGNPVPISAAALPLPTGAATETTLATRAAAATQTDGTQRTKITDGTTNAAVKAASTAPVATDPALVVAISPNSPLAVTIAAEMEVKNDSGNPIPISAASLPLPSGAATETSVAATAAVAGTTAGAAVITDVAGTLQQYLRGLVKMFAAGTALTTSVQTGAANLAVTRGAASSTAGTLAIARATRRSILIRNLDPSLTIYVAPATVTTANGFPILPGESCPFSWVGLIQVISVSGTPAYAVADEYS